LLAFASVYFFESGLFNGLQPIQTKKIGRRRRGEAPKGPTLFILVSMPDNPAGSLCREKTYSTKFGFSEEIVRGRNARGHPTGRWRQTKIRALARLVIAKLNGEDRLSLVMQRCRGTFPLSHPLKNRGGTTNTQQIKTANATKRDEKDCAI
jgi:hypothetical protein